MVSTDEDELPAPPKRPAPAARKASKTGSTSSTTANKSKGKKRAVEGDDLAAPPRKRAGPKPKTKAERRKIDKARKAERAAARGGQFSSSEDLDGPVVERAPRKPRASVKRPAREVSSSSDDGKRQKRS